MLQPRPWPSSARLREDASARQGALDDLFLRHYAGLVARAQQLVGRDRQAAEDLVHDTYVRVALRHRDAGAIHNIEGYLFTTLRNVHLSQARRRMSKVADTVSIVDYESAIVGLRSLPQGDGRQRACDALIDVVRYACIRKSTSKAASVLILRFFHGYYPGEIARVLWTTETAVAARLRMARAEARAFVSSPGRVRSFGERRISLRLDANVAHDTDSARALQHAIFEARTGACMSPEEINRIYASGTSDPLDVATLSHLVCCSACLNLVNHRLGLPLLADRDPSDRLGRGGPSNGRGGGGTGCADLTSVIRTRLDDAREDYPHELHIAVNGLFVGSQAVNGPLSEQRVKIQGTEQVGFIEVFDEHGTCLLYLDVEPPPCGLVEQSATVALSDGRRLSATLTFSEAVPAVQVIYEHPSAPFDVAQGCPERSRGAALDSHAVVERVESAAEERPASGTWRLWPLALRFAIVGIILGALLANPRQTLAAVEHARRVIVDSITQLIESVRPRGVLPSRPVTWPVDVAPLAKPAMSVSPMVSTLLPSALEELGDNELSEVALEALRLLDGAGALTADQVSVVRRPDRRVHIEGLVDSDARRRELTAVLAGLFARSVRVDLVTTDEAARRASTTPGNPMAPLRSVEVSRERVPAAYSQVRHYLIERAAEDPNAARELTAEASIDHVARRFAGEMLSRSMQARLHARTVRELVLLVPSSNAPQLSPPARAKWRGLVERHAESFRQETASLRRNLEHLFPPAAADGTDASVWEAPDRDVWALASRLFELASTHGVGVRRAFAVATDGSESLEVGRPAFRQSLIEAERLAEALRVAMQGMSNP